METKKEALKGFINHTQKQEKGITLIALIIMVILLIILAMVSIKAVTGKEGILASSAQIGNEYIIQQYKEQLEQLVHSIILKDSLLRKNNHNRKLSRRHRKRRLDKKCNTRRKRHNCYNNRWIHISSIL